ncbi:hypothetical protein GCM10007932_08620 [Vibrio penaeicida]|uniref:Uncharacterized protein n=1 Tax=Vibrio penaeicida TaxID=104609 RepID=A0AAV5NMS8_9VIBR|nr:hypothetical protein GCM10007932_08620 [Vibrio penaeicida]
MLNFENTRDAKYKVPRPIAAFMNVTSAVFITLQSADVLAFLKLDDGIAFHEIEFDGVPCLGFEWCRDIVIDLLLRFGISVTTVRSKNGITEIPF